MASMRQTVVPRTNESPSRDSNTNSSSSVPRRAPVAAWTTEYSPRSGMAPAFVTTSSLVPFLGVTSPDSRFQFTRGASSPNRAAG